MVGVWLVLFAILGTASLGVAAEPIPLPSLAPIEQGTYQARELATGGLLWTEDWVLTQKIQNGRSLVYLEEKGQGSRDGQVPTSWTLNMTVDLWGPTPRLSSTRQVRNGGGRPQQIEERVFDYGRGSGRLRFTDVRTGETKSLTVRVISQSITPELLPAILRLLPDTENHQMRFDLITREGFVLGFQAKIVGREMVEVPAGTYECYKIELDPTGIYGVLAGLLLPKLYMWHTVVAPHFWVKYQGPEGGPGSRQIVRELTRLEMAKLSG